MRITLTKKQLVRYWFFIRLWIAPELRTEVLSLIYKNLDRVDNHHDLELTIPR